jgi:hypothetical protein
MQLCCVLEMWLLQQVHCFSLEMQGQSSNKSRGDGYWAIGMGVVCFFSVVLAVRKIYKKLIKW